MALRDLLSTSVIMGGQAGWAVAQALLMIALVRFGGLELAGLFTLALAVFTPACLFTGLNLRSLIAVDNEHAIDIRTALVVRAGSVISALLLCAIVLYFAAGGLTANWLIAMGLIVARGADQSADVTMGWYQRNNRLQLIGRSYFARGAATIVPFGLVLLFGGSIALAALATLAANWVTHLAIDLRPIFRHRFESSPVSPAQLVRSLGGGLASAPYPFLDSLYFNSLRYGVVIFFGTETLGLLGVAQTLYVPLQLAITAAGYTYLTRARALVLSADRSGQLRLLAMGLAGSLLIGMAFVLFVYLIPAQWLALIFQVDGAAQKEVLLIFALATLPLPMGGFFSLSRTARREMAIISIAVGAALGLYALFLASLLLFREAELTFALVAAGYFAFALVRLLVLAQPGFAATRPDKEEIE